MANKHTKRCSTSPIVLWVQFSRSVVSDSLRHHESQHARPPCPSQTPRVYSNSCPSSWWCHPAISSSVVPFSSCPQSLLASGSFPMSQLFPWGCQSTVREMQFKTTMRYSLMPVRLAIIRKTKNNRPVLCDNMEWWGREGGGVQDGGVQDEGDTCIPMADSCWCMAKVKVAQLCPTFCDPMDYIVHGILQARILE